MAYQPHKEVVKPHLGSFDFPSVGNDKGHLLTQGAAKLRLKQGIVPCRKGKSVLNLAQVFQVYHTLRKKKNVQEMNSELKQVYS